MVSSAEFIMLDMVWLSVTGVADFTGFLVTLGDNRELEGALCDNRGLEWGLGDKRGLECGLESVENSRGEAVLVVVVAVCREGFLFSAPSEPP